MALDLTLDAVLNSAGGGLFVLEGVGILYLARASPRGRLIGALAVLFGLTFVVQNLFVHGPGSIVTDILTTLSTAGGAVAAALLIRMEAAHLTRQERRWSRIGLLLAALAVVGTMYAMVTDAASRAILVAANGWPYGFPFFVALLGTLCVLLGVVARRTREAATIREARAASSLALAFGIYVAFYIFYVLPGSGAAWQVAPALGVGFAPALLLAFAAIHTPIASSPRVYPGLGRRSYLALLAASLAGIAYGTITLPPFLIAEFGAFGIVRTIGAFLLALAVLRYDLLGVPLARFAARRGLTATAGLASLFIAAQVAQNFLSDRYGLLVGGITAGAVLFAANPIQRAMERSSERPARPYAHLSNLDAGDPAPDRRDSKAPDAIYRAAVRAAMRDGTLTRQAEIHLADIAEGLGIGPRRALEIRGEVEATA